MELGEGHPLQLDSFIPSPDVPRRPARGAQLLPRARLREVLFGKSPFIGARCNPDAPRGFVSPAEASVRLGLDYADAVSLERGYRRSWLRDLGVASRAAIAGLLSTGSEAVLERRPFVVSSRVDAITIGEACEEILSPFTDRTKLVFFAHPHALNLAYFDPALAKRLKSADLVLPDGVGLRIAAHLLGRQLPHNLNGTDMLPLLCKGAAERGLPLVLIGGKPGVAAACAEYLVLTTPGLRIPLVLDGYLDAAESRRVAEQVRGLRRAVVLVGMGTPIQEAWACEHLGDLAGVTVVTVGGLFDFFGGRIERAPPAWREMGLEWLFRLCMEPRRMAWRYLIGNPLFLTLAMLQALRGRARSPE